MARVKEIRVDESKCIGCGKCVRSCFTDVFRLDPETKKAVATYIRECEFCLICEEQCPKDAIFVIPNVPVPVPDAFAGDL